MRRTIAITIILFTVLRADRNVSAIEGLPEDAFLMGVYVYEYQMAAAASEQGRDYFEYFEEHLRILHQHGVNALYLGGTTQARFRENLRLANLYGIRVVPQLDFAYFQPTWNEVQIESYADAVARFIELNADPAVLAWSLREEPPPASMDALSGYYASILRRAPSATFATVHNDISSARKQPPPEPDILGVDRYGFWWDSSAGGYLATPAFALEWTRSEAAKFYNEAARRDADFMLVVTQGGVLMPALANRVASNSGNPTLMATVREWAAEGRMGWTVFPTAEFGERYNVWKWYRTPPNCMKALAWTAVLEGAKSFFVWHYSPQQVETDDRSAAIAETPPEVVLWYTMAGRPGVGSPELAEFADAAREIAKYDPIVANMSKTSRSPVVGRDSTTHCSAFQLPGFTGDIVVVLNADVGTWPGGTRRFFRDRDHVTVDSQGNLTGYIPHVESKPIRLLLDRQHSNLNVYDIASGERVRLVRRFGRERFEIDISPGSGTLLFVGTDEEAIRIHTIVASRTTGID